MDKLLQILALIGFSLLAFFFQMFVLIKLWGYVAVSLGAPAIDLAHAFGISLIFGLFTPLPGKMEQSGTDLAILRIVHSVVGSALALGIGYMVLG